MATISTQATSVVGTTIAPPVSISEGAGTFSAVVGNSAENTLVVRNASANAVDVRLQFEAVLSASQSDITESEFRFADQLPTASVRVPAGATQTIPFLFVPTIVGDRVALLTMRVGGVVTARLPIRRVGVSGGIASIFVVHRPTTPTGIIPTGQTTIALPIQRVGATASTSVMVYNPTAQQIV